MSQLLNRVSLIAILTGSKVSLRKILNQKIPGAPRNSRATAPFTPSWELNVCVGGMRHAFVQASRHHHCRRIEDHR
jgi:hypothetical protein